VAQQVLAGGNARPLGKRLLTHPEAESALSLLREELTENNRTDLVFPGATFCPICQKLVSINLEAGFGLCCESFHDGGEMFAAVSSETLSKSANRRLQIEERLDQGPPVVAVQPGSALFRESVQSNLFEAYSATDGARVVRVDPSTLDASLCPSFPSGMPGLDFFGLTVLVGEPGCGKSLIGISCGLDSYQTGGWDVAYLGVEIDKGEMSFRVGRCHQSQRLPRINIAEIGWLMLQPGQIDMGQVVEKIGNVATGEKKLLVIIDSINSLAELGTDGTMSASLGATTKLFHWATQVRMHTGGNVSFLIISETNAGGGVKGRKGSFSADLVINLVKTPERGIVEAVCIKSRSRPTFEPVPYEIDWDAGRMCLPGEGSRWDGM